MINIIWAFLGILIWFTAFTVAVVAITFMAKSIVKGCREIGYGVQGVVRKWRKWRMYRSHRKYWERLRTPKYSTEAAKALAKGMMGGLMLPRGLWEGLYRSVQPHSECDYAYGKCFTCGRKIEKVITSKKAKDQKCWKHQTFNYVVGGCMTCGRRIRKATLRDIVEGYNGSDCDDIRGLNTSICRKCERVEWTDEVRLINKNFYEDLFTYIKREEHHD